VNALKRVLIFWLMICLAAPTFAFADNYADSESALEKAMRAYREVRTALATTAAQRDSLSILISLQDYDIRNLESENQWLEKSCQQQLEAERTMTQFILDERSKDWKARLVVMGLAAAAATALFIVGVSAD